MRSRLSLSLSLLLVSGLLGSLLFTGVASATTRAGSLHLYATRLTGAAELPGPGDDDGRGRAFLTVNANNGTICYSLSVRGIDPAQAAHIHEIADMGVGPVVQALQAPTSGSSRACVVNAEVAAGIVADPTEYYVNVHNEAFPAGAVRGDLR